MERVGFMAVCPLEIGDTVAIRVNRKVRTVEEPLDAMYLPPNATILMSGKEIRIAIVTDIASIHYCKTGETQFIYELDNSKTYKPMKVSMPVAVLDKELKKRDR